MKKATRFAIVAAAAFGTITVGQAGAVMANHPQPTTKDDCKNGGFAEYKESGMANAAQRFSNQGQCIRFVNTGEG
jgi:hypothetical protein